MKKHNVQNKFSKWTFRNNQTKRNNQINCMIEAITEFEVKNSRKKFKTSLFSPSLKLKFSTGYSNSTKYKILTKFINSFDKTVIMNGIGNIIGSFFQIFRSISHGNFYSASFEQFYVVILVAYC